MQYEFVREFFTSNTIGLMIDTAFVFIFLIVIYMNSGWLAIIPAIALILSVVSVFAPRPRSVHRMAAAANEATRSASHCSLRRSRPSKR